VSAPQSFAAPATPSGVITGRLFFVTLQAVAAATQEGKRLAARVFQIDYDTQAELHALLIRATKLAGGMP